MIALPATRAELDSPISLVRAHAWEITRTDQIVVRATDYDRPFWFSGAQGPGLFRPVLSTAGLGFPEGGFEATAMRKAGGGSEQTKDVRGLLVDDSEEIISEKDLRSGRYRDAEVYEHVLDPRFPWAGALLTHRWWVDAVTFDGQTFGADMTGMGRFLRQFIGRTFTRTCSNILGQGRCAFDMGGNTFTGFPATLTGATVAAIASRNEFTLAHASFTTQPAGFYKYGSVEFTFPTSDLEKIKEEVRFSEAAAGGQIEITLEEELPFDVTFSDTCTVLVGCDKTRNACINKFDEFDSFRGFDTVPGTGRILKTPDAN